MFKENPKIKNKELTPEKEENENLAEKVKFFHDQKHNDFDTETGITYSGGYKNTNNLIFNDDGEREKEIGGQKELRVQIDNVIATINSLQLKDGFQNNQEQIELLKNKKEIAKKLIFDIFTKITKYVDDVRETERLFAREKEDDLGNTLCRELTEASKLRRMSHQSLIESISIAKRFIENNFGIIEENAQKDWEKNETTAKRNIAHVKRMQFGQNVVCPALMDIKDREQVAAWAFQIYETLLSIKK